MWTWSYTLSEVNDSALLNLANLLDVERKWAFLENLEMYKDKYIELSSRLCVALLVDCKH
jgi:hypothetical protein